MANITFKRNSKNEIEKAFVTGVSFYYARIKDGTAIYDQRDWAKPTHFEYTVDCVVDEDTADAIEENFPKTSIKKFSKEKFMENFKVESEEDLPFDAKKYYVVKFKQSAQNKDGEPINPALRPRAIDVSGEKPVDITADKLVGNGSSGAVMLAVSSNPTYGTFCYLRLMKIESLVEYESSDSAKEDMEDFLGGAVEFADLGEPAHEASKGSGTQDVPFDVEEEGADEFSDADLEGFE